MYWNCVCGKFFMFHSICTYFSVDNLRRKPAQVFSALLRKSIIRTHAIRRIHTMENRDPKHRIHFRKTRLEKIY